MSTDLVKFNRDPFDGYAFRGIKNLRPGNYIPPNVTAEEYEYYTREIIKCFNDPLYFIQNYYKIVAPGRGEIYLRDPYPKQREFITAMLDKKRIIACWSRQCGKCCFSDTKIKIRNKHTNEIMELTAEEFHAMCEK